MLPSNHFTTCCLLVILTVIAITSSYAADWPQFEGPNRNGVSPETRLARSWPVGGPCVLWTAKSTLGNGGVAVRDGEVYFLEQDQATGKTTLRCLDFATGAEKWRYTFADPKMPYGALSTPTVDQRFVFVIGAGGEMHCLDRKTHASRWQANLVADFTGKVAEWGVSQSPLLYKNWVIVAPQSPEAGVVALEKATGKRVWKSDAIGVMGYSSPFLTTIDNVEQLIMIGKGGRGETEQAHPNLVGIDPANGKILWKYNGWRCDHPIPWPTPVGDGRFFLCGWYSATGTMLKVEHTAGQWRVNELYTGKPYMTIIQHNLYYDGLLYVTFNGLHCIDLNGNEKWHGKSNFGSGNFIIADHLIYTMDSDSGMLYLVEATPNGYKELAKAQVLAGKEIYMPLALANGKLLVRDRQQIKCLDVKNP